MAIKRGWRQPRVKNIYRVVEMGRLYFYFYKKCCACLFFVHFTLLLLPYEHWPAIPKHLKPIKYGFLLIFYLVMDQGNVTITKQYEFYRTLRVASPTYYRSF